MLFGLVVLSISISLHKKSEFTLYHILLNIVAFSISILVLVYCIWYKKIYNKTPKLILCCLIHLVTSFIIIKPLSLLVLFEYAMMFLYFSGKKINGFTDVDPEIESYLAVAKKNKAFFAPLPLYIAIIMYACIALFIASRTLPLWD